MTECPKCGKPLFPHCSDFMVREGRACRGDCQNVQKRPSLPLPAPRSAIRGESIEDILAGQLDLHKIAYQRQFKFHHFRRWRSDFHLTGTLYLIECVGLKYQQEASGHQTYSGVEKDLEKLNAAVLLGYRPLGYTGRQIRSGYAINEITDTLKEI